MRGFAMTVMAMAMFAAMAISAQADDIHGAPMRQGNKCFKFSPGADIKESRFGAWVDCPQTASTNVATPRAARRHHASR
jgi:hypothetical protein